MTDAIILIGGTPPANLALPAERHQLVIAADIGLSHADALELTVDVVVGDFDSVDPELLDEARARGAHIEAHPPDKDVTDFELALAAARDRGATSVLVVGGTDGRFDHALANLLVLAGPQYADLRVRAHLGEANITVVHDACELTGSPGATVTLLPIGGPAMGVTTSGLQWPLHNEILEPGSGRGVSNRFLTTTAHVALQRGTIVAIQPDSSAMFP